MSYNVQEVNSFTRKILFSFKGDLLGDKIKEALKSKSNKVELKGFRKGKAPVSMVENLFGHEIEMEAVERFVSDKYFEALQSENINPISKPSISNLDYKPKEEISFEALVEVVPEIKLDYEKLPNYSFNKENTAVSNDDVQNAFKSILHDKSRYEESDAAVTESGCAVVVNAKVLDHQGNLIKEESDVEIHVGHHHHDHFQHGFEESLVGCKKGDKKNFTLKADHSFAENLQGTDVSYQVEVLEVKKEVLPELNDELAKEFGQESIAQLESRIKEDLLAKRENHAQEKLQSEIFDQIFSDNKFEVPSSLVQMEVEESKNQMKRYMKGVEKFPDLFEKLMEAQKERMEKEATVRVVRSLIIGQMIRDWGLTLDDAEIDTEINAMAMEEGKRPNELKKMLLDGRNNEMNFRYHLLTGKLIDLILKKVKITNL